MKNCIQINKRRIGPGYPVYVVAELSANHGQDFKKAVEIIKAAKKSGADAVKIQTYTADTLTIDCDNKYFKIGKGTIWEGRTLYGLYGEAYTPWDWQPRLKIVAEKLGLDFFSTPFDPSSVEFLQKMKMPAYKVASFELVDLPLIRRIAKTGKPMIMSTGMASLKEIGEAVKAARSAGCRQLALLKCTSAYPANSSEMNLKTIPDMERKFGTVGGLSDHTLGSAVSVAAVSLGASIIEKHITLSRKDPGPDSAFSLEPSEFKEMVDAIRTVEAALGKVNYAVSEKEAASRMFRRSLFVVADVKAGEKFTAGNVRSIRPGHGLAPKYLDAVLGKKAKMDIPRGTPLQKKMF
ncbi:MAG TPA: pseudaminic acid synthase [Lentisphaeria bacterium]|nr:MAG: pseudaminic acid synthase [Lentisphaerae bacterium GWF2_50_93]HCE45648.1 pseudaminic acid synthase [Lentisphaeria bacterium]